MKIVNIDTPFETTIQIRTAAGESFQIIHFGLCTISFSYIILAKFLRFAVQSETQISKFNCHGRIVFIRIVESTN